MGCANSKSHCAGHESSDDDCSLCGGCFSRPALCKGCSASVPVFKRKKCSDCGEVHCSNCLHWESSRQSGDKVCSKCLILASGQFTPQDLMAYSVRELRQFLFRKEIAISNCKEKADLIELAMQLSRSIEYLSALDERSRHVQQLRERMQMEEHSYEQVVPAESVSNRSSASGLQDTPTVVLNPVLPEKNETFSEEKPSDVNAEYLLAGVVFSLPGQVADVTPAEFKEAVVFSSVTDSLRNRETGERITDSSEAERTEGFADVEEEVHESVDVSGLLDTNEIPVVVSGTAREDVVSVGDKTCVQSVDSDVHPDRREGSKVLHHLCLICSTATRDCVFLECGHMLTCYACGERQIECPMCHSYISRTVRAFRA